MSKDPKEYSEINDTTRWFNKWMDDGQHESDNIPVVELMLDFAKHYMKKRLEEWDDDKIDNSCKEPYYGKSLAGSVSRQKFRVLHSKREGMIELRDKLLKDIE